MPLDFLNNITCIFQESSFLLQLEIQNFDIVCSPVWTSRDRCCDLPSMVSINEPEAIQKIVINSWFNNINISLVLYLMLTTHLNHSSQSSQWNNTAFQSFVSEGQRLYCARIESLRNGGKNVSYNLYCSDIYDPRYYEWNSCIFLFNLFLDWHSKSN